MSTDCACFNVRKAARALTAFYDRVIAPIGLRATQGTLLVALARAGDIPVTRLAGILGMDRTTLTRNLEPLERDGLVALRPDRTGGSSWPASPRRVARRSRRRCRSGGRPSGRSPRATGAGRWTELRRELGRITALADETAGHAAEPDEGRTHHRRKS